MALEIHAMNMGDVRLDSTFLVWAMNPGTPVVAPCTSYLILGGETPLMVDAGFRYAVEPFSQTPEQTLEANLALHGLEPGDVGLVIHTHLHVDHSGLDDRLPNARIAVQRRELQYAAAPLFPRFFYLQEDIATLVNPLWDRLELLDGDAEIAPGIRAIATGGHTPGHQMLYVDLDSGQAVITGDLAYLAVPGVSEQAPPGYFTDLAQVMAALARIKRDAQHVLPMHDRTVYEQYPDGVR